MSFLERHRPQSVGQLVFASDLTREQISMQMARTPPRCLLLHGPFGSGKSVAAEAIARTLLDDNYEFNVITKPADQITIGSIDGIRRFFGLVPVCAPFRLAVINELHKVKPDVQVALRDVADTIDPYGFIVATVNDMSAVDPGILDRFSHIFLDQPVGERWMGRARQILAAEGVVVPDATLLSILKNNDRSIRTIMRALEDLVDMARANARQQKAAAGTK